jgi:4-hydroxybenzoate polyprenyltransferase
MATGINKMQRNCWQSSISDSPFHSDGIIFTPEMQEKMKAENQPLWKTTFGFIRWPNLLIILFIQTIGYFTLVKQEWKDNPIDGYFFLLELVVMTLCAATAGYMVNDILDRKADTVNDRVNVIAAGRISIRQAWYNYFFAVAIGAWVTFSLARWSPHYLWIYGLATLMLWTYSKYLKRLPLIGNVAVSSFCAGAVLILWYPVLPLSQIPDELRWLTIFAFVTTLIREIVKDIEDLAGDRQVGDKTLPVVLGIQITKVIAMLLLCGSIAALFHPELQKVRVNPFEGAFWIGTLALFFLTLAYLLFIARSKSEFHIASLLLKLAMLTGTLFLVL